MTQLRKYMRNVRVLSSILMGSFYADMTPYF
jgi:hypothetical protein